MHALGQHREALVDHRADHPGGVEAAAVVDHDRGLADRLHDVVGLGQRLVGGLLAADDLDQRHLVDGAEEVQADEVRAGRSSRPVASSVIGSVEVFEHSSASGSTCGATSAKTCAFSAGSSKTASITRSQPARSAGSCGGGDPGQQLVLLLGGRAAARDRLVEQVRRVGLALLGVLDRDVLQHDLHPGAGAGVGDPGAHHPGAEHADLGRAERREAVRAQRAGVDRLEVEEERLDHVLRALVDDQAGEVARLDPRGGVEVDLRALDGGGEDRARRGVDGTLGLLAQQRRERRQERRQLGVARRAAGHLVAGGVPRVLRGVGVGLDPGLGGRDELLAGGDDLVDEALLQRGGRLEAGAGQQHVHQRGLQAEQPDDAGHAAAAGQQAQGGLGQADLGLGVVHDDAVVAWPGRSRSRRRARRR